MKYGLVAQLDRAPDYESGGCRFESCRGHNKLKLIFSLPLKGIRNSKTENVMSKICQLTGKRPITGNNVSHSNAKTKRRFLPNIQKKRFFIPELDKTVTLKVSTKAIKIINKLGIYAYLKKLERSGVETGVKLK